MPTFIGVGTARSGSTAIYKYLDSHPEVLMSKVKETKFFSCEGKPPIFNGPGDAYWKDAITELSEYQKSFGKLRKEKAIGEVTPLYLLYPQSAERIQHYVPHAKIFAIFRNPVDRAYSHFAVNWMRNEETVDNFADALRLEQRRIDKGWSPKYQYTRWGFYYRQWKRYVDIFPSQQLRIYLYEDFSRDPLSVMQDLYTLIGVDRSFTPDTKPINSWKQADRRPKPDRLRWQSLISFARHTGQGNLKFITQSVKDRFIPERKPPVLSPSIRAELIEIYRDDITRFQDLIGRDLGAWISSS